MKSFNMKIKYNNTSIQFTSITGRITSPPWIGKKKLRGVEKPKK